MTTILVIEDEPAIRENLVETLELGGFDAMGACDGYQGIDLARQITPDCVICDIMMNGLDGFGVLEMLRSENATQQLPFIFVTALSDGQALQQARDLGADAYLTKPFATDDLLDAVSMQLQYRSPQPTQTDRMFAAARSRILELAADRVGRSLERVNSVRELLSRRLHALDDCALSVLSESIIGDDEDCTTPVTASHLVGQVALLARLDTGAFDRTAQCGNPLSLRELWMVALDQAREFVPARPDVDIHLDVNTGTEEDSLMIAGDAGMLRHALAELLANALAASPPNGSLTLSLRQAQACVWFSVADQGTGMPVATIAAIQGDATPEYSGLGWHLVRRVARTFGGDITVQSNPATGTVAAMWLPTVG